MAAAAGRRRRAPAKMGTTRACRGGGDEARSRRRRRRDRDEDIGNIRVAVEMKLQRVDAAVIEGPVRRRGRDDGERGWRATKMAMAENPKWV